MKKKKIMMKRMKVEDEAKEWSGERTGRSLRRRKCAIGKRIEKHRKHVRKTLKIVKKGKKRQEKSIKKNSAK